MTTWTDDKEQELFEAQETIAELLEALEEWNKRPSDQWQDAIDTDDGYTLTPYNILENKTRDLIRKASLTSS